MNEILSQSSVLRPSSWGLTSQERCSRHLITFVASSGPSPVAPCLFFFICGDQNRTQHFTYGLNRVSGEVRIAFLDLLARLFLMHTRIVKLLITFLTTSVPQEPMTPEPMLRVKLLNQYDDPRLSFYFVYLSTI